MFDPTIFDNLKVVLEGSLYDQDAEGHIAVTRREDLFDLAGMGRSFRMEIRLPNSPVNAVIRLSAGLADFAAELRGIRLAGERPGAELDIVYRMPGEPAFAGASAVLERMDKLWGSGEVDLSHEEIIHRRNDSEEVRSYRFLVRFRQRMDESHMKDLESLVDHLILSLKALEEGF